jgi:general secretion pathway protein D
VQGQTLFGGAIVDRRETTTQLIVQDGQTVVISGILRSEDSNIVRKVPLLGDIPLLGWIFRSTEKSKSNSEVLVFITPLVVDNPSDNDRVNAPYLERLKQREESINRNTPKEKDKEKAGEQPSLPGSIIPETRPTGSSS